RLIAGARKQHADIMVEIGTARGSLYPFGKQQERSLNFVPLLARYGPALRDEMLKEAERHVAMLIGTSGMSEAPRETVSVRGQSGQKATTSLKRNTRSTNFSPPKPTR